MLEPKGGGSRVSSRNSICMLSAAEEVHELS
jgi:hypothetical protein